MIKPFFKTAGIVLAAAMATGCATKTTYVDPAKDNVVVMGLDYKDFEKAASQAVDEIVASPLMVHPESAKGARYVLAVSKVLNDTTQRIDTDQLTKKIRIDLLQSGRFITTTAVGLNGPEDRMTGQVRDLADSKMINKDTVKGNGTVVAPDFSMSGKIIQRTHKVDRKTQQVDYYFHSTLKFFDGREYNIQATYT